MTAQDEISETLPLDKCLDAFLVLAKRWPHPLGDSVLTHLRRLQEVEDLVRKICDLFHIGSDARTAQTIFANIENASRRSVCLSEVERYHTVEKVDDDGEEYDECPLSWGDDRDEYGRKYTILMQEVEAELEMCRRDAERYRWLRSKEAGCNVEIPKLAGDGYILTGYEDSLDEAIDATISAGEGK